MRREKENLDIQVVEIRDNHLGCRRGARSVYSRGINSGEIVKRCLSEET